MTSRVRTFLASLLLAVGAVLSMGANAQDEPHDFLSPLVDHHEHLLSPMLAKHWSGKLADAKPSPAIGALLASVEKNWSNEAALAQLYDQDAILIEPRSEDPVQGRTAVAERLSHLFQAGYKLATGRFNSDGRTAYAMVYLERPRDGKDLPFGVALMTFRRGADHKWRIAQETLKAPDQIVLSPFGASDLITLLDQAGIRRAVILSAAYAWSGIDAPPSSEEYARVRAENDWTAQQVAQYPDRLVAFCGVNPLKDYALEEIRRCAGALHMKGVKLHFSNSGVVLTNPDHLKRVQAVFAEADRLRLPIVVHLQTQPPYGAPEAKIFLDEVLSQAPHVVVQIAHMAGAGPGWNDDAFAVFADAIAAGDPRTAKLYFDIATVAEGQSYGRLNLLAKRIRQVGVSRILFGSDAIYGVRPTPRQQWAMFQGYVPLSPAEFAAIANNVAPYLK